MRIDCEELDDQLARGELYARDRHVPLCDYKVCDFSSLGQRIKLTPREKLLRCVQRAFILDEYHKKKKNKLEGLIK